MHWFKRWLDSGVREGHEADRLADKPRSRAGQAAFYASYSLILTFVLFLPMWTFPWDGMRVLAIFVSAWAVFLGLPLVGQRINTMTTHRRRWKLAWRTALNWVLLVLLWGLSGFLKDARSLGLSELAVIALFALLLAPLWDSVNNNPKSETSG
jgi:hypothetical protein